MVLGAFRVVRYDGDSGLTCIARSGGRITVMYTIHLRPPTLFAVHFRRCSPFRGLRVLHYSLSRAARRPRCGVERHPLHCIHTVYSIHSTPPISLPFGPSFRPSRSLSARFRGSVRVWAKPPVNIGLNTTHGPNALGTAGEVSSTPQLMSEAQMEAMPTQPLALKYRLVVPQLKRRRLIILYPSASCRLLLLERSAS
jgi:hypothetical protein